MDAEFVGLWFSMTGLSDGFDLLIGRRLSDGDLPSGEKGTAGVIPSESGMEMETLLLLSCGPLVQVSAPCVVLAGRFLPDTPGSSTIFADTPGSSAVSTCLLTRVLFHAFAAATFLVYSFVFLSPGSCERSMRCRSGKWSSTSAGVISKYPPTNLSMQVRRWSMDS
jgi:hypothetical protein